MSQSSGFARRRSSTPSTSCTSALGASRVLDAPSPPRLVALLVTCLCWQARWSDALQHGLRRTPCHWTRRSRSRVSGRGSSLAMPQAPWPMCTQRWRQAPADAAIAQLRVDVASGAVDALRSVAHADGRYALGRECRWHDDDQVLLPAEGLVSRSVPLPESPVRRLRALTRYDVPRLVRARARLSSRAGLGARSRPAADCRRSGTRRAWHQRPGARRRAGSGVGLAGAL